MIGFQMPNYGIAGFGAVTLACRKIVKENDLKICGKYPTVESIEKAKKLDDYSQLRCEDHPVRSRRKK